MINKKDNKAKYAKIVDDIRKKIKDGYYNAGDRISGEQQLAEAYNVSRITSKKALDELENEGLVYRIKGSGSYVAKQSEEQQSKNTLNMIAVIFPFSRLQGGGMDIIHGVETIAKEEGYYVSLHNTQGNIDNEREIIIKLMRDGIKGIIYYPIYTAENFDIISMVASQGYPMVIIDKYIHDISIDSVVTDNFKGSYCITEHLIQNGHKNIAFVSGSPIEERSSLRERFLGYSKALEDYKIPLKPDHIIYDSSRYMKQWDLEKNDPELYRGLLENLIEKYSITAVVAFADEVAAKFIKAAHQMGVKVPEELSVVGFDDLETATLVQPPLTTVRQDFYQMGVKAAKLVTDKIRNPNKGIEKIRLPVEVIVRKSTAVKKA